MADYKELYELARRVGSFSKAGALMHDDEQDYGISDIENLHSGSNMEQPTNIFDTYGNDTWVQALLSGVSKTPYSKLKSVTIKSTDASAKKYNRLSKKIENTYFTDEPVYVSAATIYTKNKIDRDDMLDITDFDILEWLKTDMKYRLAETIAAQILFGTDSDISDSTILPLVHDSRTINVPMDENLQKLVSDIRIGILKIRTSGVPAFWIRQSLYNAIMAMTDVPYTMSKKALAEYFGVSNVYVVPDDLFENHDGIYGVVLNPSDYRIGVPKNGEETFFNDFDIDTNSNTVLLEKKICGMLSAAGKAVVIGEGGGPGPLVDADVYLTDAVKAVAVAPNGAFYGEGYKAGAAICFNNIDTNGLTIDELADLSMERGPLNVYAEWDFEETTFSGVFEAQATDWGTIEGYATDEMGNEINLAIDWCVSGTSEAIEKCRECGVYTSFQVVMPTIWNDENKCNVICPGFMNLRDQYEYEYDDGDETGIYYDFAVYPESDLEHAYNQRLFATSDVIDAFSNYVAPLSEGQTVDVPDLIVIGHVKKSKLGNYESLYWKLPYYNYSRENQDIGTITFQEGFNYITIEVSNQWDSLAHENQNRIKAITNLNLSYDDAINAWNRK